MLQLLPPSESLAKSYFEFIDEMKQLGEKVWEGMVPCPDESTTQFIESLMRASAQPSPGKVKETTYWACEENTVVGRIALRHELTDSLREFGGHIGYEVKPSRRKQGIAKEMLREILKTPQAKKIGRLLLTCSPQNIASNKTILANGGVLEKTAYVEKWHRDTNYYWIQI